MGDTRRFKKLAGGMQIEAKFNGIVGESGSLGCIAQATDTGRAVLLSCAHVIADSRGFATVGQPSMSTCCDTFSHPVGQVVRTTDPKEDLQCDAAIAEIQGIGWEPQVLEIGVIKGVRHLDETDANQLQLPVQMRGAETGRVTRGKILKWDKDKVRNDYPSKGGHFFYRYATDQLWIIGDEGSRPFAQGGDSGSVVLDMDNNVVALLHGVSGDIALAAPIQFVETRMKIKVLSATTPPAPIDPALSIAQHLAADERTGTLLDSPTGQVIAALIDRHVDEIRSLVRSRLRVAAVWRRNGGPDLMQALVESANRTGRALPVEVNGKPFAESFRAILRILDEHGSPVLRADIGRYGEFLASCGGQTLSQIVDRFPGER